jgi:hypothetical protein|tara:strand:- start:2057 stop:2461 length:405 start_codon:yes stop_codon:yes gene_type:complete
MAKTQHTDWAFGQMGSLFLDASGAASPPDGKVFTAITFLADTVFDASGGLVAQTKRDVENGANTGPILATVEGLEWIGTEAAAHNVSDGSETTISGSGGLQIDASNTFPKGVTIYGRWIEIDLTSGMIIAYIGE